MQKLKRILALAGVVLLLGIYVVTLITAFFTNLETRGLFMACLFSTFAIPILLYAMFLVAKLLKEKNQDMHQDQLAGREEDLGNNSEIQAVEEKNEETSENSYEPPDLQTNQPETEENIMDTEAEEEMDAPEENAAYENTDEEGEED